jgi:hypothetical protein
MPSEWMHYSCRREPKSINENSNKNKSHYDMDLQQDYLVHYLHKEKTQKNGSLGPGLWVESQTPA